jgi:hypothetical protein
MYLAPGLQEKLEPAERTSIVSCRVKGFDLVQIAKKCLSEYKKEYHMLGKRKY